MKHVAALVALSLLTACGISATTPSPDGTWSYEEIEGVPRLSRVEHGVETLRMECRNGQLNVVVSGFTPVASNEELSLGTEGDAFLLVADPSAVGVNGVVASGAVPPALMEHLRRGGTVSAVYGPQRYGPAPTPPPDAAQAFAGRCLGE